MSDLGNYSRFTLTDDLIVENQESLGIWQQYSWLKKRPSDEFIGALVIQNQFEGRPDQLAYQIYGSPLLYWVLIAFNAIHNNDKLAMLGLNWPKSGQIIIYPLDIIVFPEVVR
jgi:hypothetical protein